MRCRSARVASRQRSDDWRSCGVRARHPDVPRPTPSTLATAAATACRSPRPTRIWRAPSRGAQSGACIETGTAHGTSSACTPSESRAASCAGCIVRAAGCASGVHRAVSTSSRAPCLAYARRSDCARRGSAPRTTLPCAQRYVITFPPRSRRNHVRARAFARGAQAHP